MDYQCKPLDFDRSMLPIKPFLKLCFSVVLEWIPFYENVSDAMVKASEIDIPCCLGRPVGLQWIPLPTGSCVPFRASSSLCNTRRMLTQSQIRMAENMIGTAEWFHILPGDIATHTTALAIANKTFQNMWSIFKSINIVITQLWNTMFPDVFLLTNNTYE